MYQSLQMIQTSSNKIIIEKIHQKLLKGDAIHDFLSQYLPKAYRIYFDSFIQILPFEQAFMLSERFITQNNTLKKHYYQKILVPFVLFFFTMIAVLCFFIYCFPILASIMQEFHVDIYFFIVLKNVLIFIIIFILLFLIVGFLIYLLMKYARFKVSLFKKMCYLPCFEMIKVLMSHLFVSLFYQCHQCGFSTRQSVETLQSLTQNELIQFMAKEIEKTLLKGEGIEKALNSIYFDKQFFKTFSIFQNTTKENSVFEAYLRINELKVNAFFKKVVGSVKIISYISIAIILIFVYQILLLPLSIIQTL